MNIIPEQFELEKEYLQKTLEVIKSLIDSEDVSIQNKINAINEMKRYIWENNATLDDVEISQGMYNVNSDVEYTNDKMRRLQKLKKSLSNPYFGRVDFDDGNDINSIYIGINGIMKDLFFYVFDWRSPIASLFYNYGTGPASYEAPAGKVDGEIKLKRQYKINGDEIERCFDSDINIDDEYLQEILSSSSSEKMTNIVNTIQKEQNEIIRNVNDKYLIVQGIAGSGKTSVALHRIAYLLYRESNLKSSNVLIFSPNEVFSEYISEVLPELGEDNVMQTTYSDFASAYIKGFKKVESFTEFIERYYKSETVNHDEYQSTKYKLSNEFRGFLDSFIEDFKSTISFSRGVIINGKEVSRDELNSLLKSRYSKLPFYDRFEVIAQHLCNLNNISYKKYGKIIIEKLVTLLNKSIDIKEIYASIINSEEYKKNAQLDGNSNFSFGKVLKYEDLLPLMYIFFSLNGYPKGRHIRHVIIDEAQDYTLLQLEMLKNIFSGASFTILGDIHQTINPYYMYGSLDEINSLFDGKGRYIELSKTYRSSEEIIDYTNDILGINNACSVRKSNSIPVTIRNVSKKDVMKQLVDDIKQMKELGMKRIAIITKNNSETTYLYDILKDQLSDIYIVEEGNGLIGDTVILPSYISKGLEFDGVIAYTDKNNMYQEKDRYLFYVVCTRAQHCLTVYNQLF